MMRTRTGALCRIAVCIAMAAVVAWTGLAETVTNVRGMQRKSSNFVDIYYDLESTDGGVFSVKVEVEGKTGAVSASSLSGDVGGYISPGRNRHVVWNAGADWSNNKGDVRVVVTTTKEDDVKRGKVQLWAGGPYWATTNIGAEKPWDYGLYFWWGDTVGYKRENNAWVATNGSSYNFSFGSPNTPTYDKSPATLQSEGWIVSKDGTYVLAPEHDAAQVQWGDGWRMPTCQELDDLCENCDWTLRMVSGVNGYVVSGRGDYSSNSIFLPCCGCGYGASFRGAGSGGDYWSSVPYSDSYDGSWGLEFSSSHSYHGSWGLDRSYGFSVRPVQGFTE